MQASLHHKSHVGLIEDEKAFIIIGIFDINFEYFTWNYPRTLKTRWRTECFWIE